MIPVTVRPHRHAPGRARGRHLAASSVAVAAGLLLTACNGSTGTGVNVGVSGSASLPTSISVPTASASSAILGAGDAQAQVREAFQTFFAGSTPAQQKIDLLQNGDQFSSVIQGQAQLPLAQQTSVKVNNVQVNGDQATVNYDILVAGQPALTNQTGTAVKVNGQWKVGLASFCTLLGLSGTLPSACPSAAASANASVGASVAVSVSPTG